MTIKQYIKKYGIQNEIDVWKRFQSVDVNFTNNGTDDEVQFDVCSVATAAGIEELSNLYNEFCAENHIVKSDVTCVTVVDSSDDLE